MEKADRKAELISHLPNLLKIVRKSQNSTQQPDQPCALGEGGWKKNRKKKLTNVSLVCMYVGRKSEMSVFFCFFPNRSNLSTISMVAWEKNRKMSVFM